MPLVKHRRANAGRRLRAGSHPQRRGGFRLAFEVAGELAEAVEILRRGSGCRGSLVGRRRGGSRTGRRGAASPARPDRRGRRRGSNWRGRARRYCRRPWSRACPRCGLVAERRLEHAAIDRLLPRPRSGPPRRRSSRRLRGRRPRRSRPRPRA